ncbi:MAG: 50S ribosomal protein L23 [Candidatus Moranbacteria bacterium GW2011_GWE2_35_2-]|nr:MAG: 50S ribosomal protein L23 [Candidatus Moranbacteria bacterium GW2011_GWE2_35_2-]KKQ04925.1 MAG: 50S ribosomal protein L23 [Candidatus Moranbacteria bacterium GW2011_GWF1_36_4]KKQ22929.1 MAG: 50S ribosomal protein L23 [Candidatus Moranbacteria bacterium GW2011_GWF2_37_11]KKQ29287.1 MAG: 50S ribosomal protein L23 [Candidatus Moranbacteria bacterium GW2011_GWD1_37_17]KKQ30840.1 MAG: 50S ribosomal protein L23 [Candidatus Moranbacteria bacterium GW2011_GWE1_37_24]KKQ47957.1 MAG: 50S ribosom
MSPSNDVKNENENKAEFKNKADLKMETKEVKNSLAYRYLIAPWITEKSHSQMASNKYIFKVFKNSNKKNIAAAVESLYGVDVIGVNTVSISSKKRRYGKTIGKKSAIKKAMVSLKEGDKIDIFEGA